MSKSARLLVACLAIVAAAVAVIVRTSTHATVAVAATPKYTPAELLDSNIAFYEKVAKRDSTGGMALGTLAIFYMRRARATGDYQDVLRSEEAARLSLHNRGAHNTKAQQALAASLLSEHRFTEAAVVSKSLVDRDSSNVAFRAALGEVQMELGHYDQARTWFATVAGDVKDPSVAPRLARWAELQGRPEESYKLLDESLLAILDRKDVPDEQKAWYWLRLGDVQFRRGKIDEAEYAYKKGLDTHTDDYRLLAAMAKLETARRNWQSAIDFGGRAVAQNFDPATLGFMSDSYAALGDTARANEYAHAMEVAVSKQATAYHRAWSLFLLDHGLRVNEVLSKSQEDLRTRQDIYGYDVTAWALHAAGRNAEAHEMMQHALALHTQDAMLFYHAATIDRALGHTAVATTELDSARTISRYLLPVSAQ